MSRAHGERSVGVSTFANVGIPKYLQLTLKEGAESSPGFYRVRARIRVRIRSRIRISSLSSETDLLSTLIKHNYQ